MHSALRYLLPILLVSVGGSWWIFSSRPSLPPEPELYSQQPVASTPWQAAPEQTALAVVPPDQSSTIPMLPIQGAVPTAMPNPPKGTASKRPTTGARHAQVTVADEVADSLQASLTERGFSTLDVKRILEIILESPAAPNAGSPATAQGIYAPSLDDLAEDFWTRLTAAGFSPKESAQILEVVLAQPGDGRPAADIALEAHQELRLTNLADDFHGRLQTAGFSPQDSASILQAVLSPLFSGHATEETAAMLPQEFDVAADHEDTGSLQAGLTAEGFSAQEVEHIVAIMLTPPATAETDAEQGIYAPSLEELTEDLQNRFSAAGFSPKNVAAILRTVLATPAEVAAAAAATALHDGNDPEHDMTPAYIEARLLAAGFSPQEIPHILHTLLPPAGQ